MPDIAIRFAGPGDGDALAAPIDAMDICYGDPERPAGYAAFVTVHPGSDLRGPMFLKDVYVAADHRNQGIGERIMQFLAKICTDQGLGHIDWVVETERTGAFYERLGATLKPHKHFMRLDGKALADLAGN